MTDSPFDLIRRYNRHVLTNRIRPDWPDSFPVQPFDHQIDGACAFLESDGRMMLGWEMGSGKTIGAALIAHAINAGPMVMFAPASVLLQHKREMQKALPNREIHIFKDKLEVTDADNALILVSYHRTKGFKECLKTLPFRFELAVLDESTFIKSHKAKRTKDIEAMLQSIPLVLMLSGTPILNRPVDLFTQLRITNPDTFKDWWRFTRQYCNGHQGPFGYLADGLSHADELASLTKSVMHRVLKSECMDLPQKIRTKLPVKIAAKEYDDWQQETLDVGMQKAVHAYDWYVDWRTSNPEGKLVIFTTHVDVAKQIAAAIGNERCVFFTGETPQSERQKLIHRFEHDPFHNTSALIATIGAGGMGLNLQFADTLLFVEMDFSPMLMLQAEDRIHRAGMKSDVNINYMVAEDTYDEKLFRLLISKYGMAHRVIDGLFDKDQNVFAEVFQQTRATLVDEVA